MKLGHNNVDLNGFVVLYSTNTWLAYMIAETYYNQRHYVWCTPFFDPEQRVRRDSAVPPSSSPRQLYKSLDDDVNGTDGHSSRIKENRVGLIRGANAKKKQGIINARKKEEICLVVEKATLNDFRPLLYIIPCSPLVNKLVRTPPVEDKAHPLSAEYTIEMLPREHFDVIEWRDVR